MNLPVFILEFGNRKFLFA